MDVDIQIQSFISVISIRVQYLFMIYPTWCFYRKGPPASVSEYDVKNYYKTSGWAQWLARHTWFENFTMTIIAPWKNWCRWSLVNGLTKEMFQLDIFMQKDLEPMQPT